MSTCSTRHHSLQVSHDCSTSSHASGLELDAVSSLHSVLPQWSTCTQLVVFVKSTRTVACGNMSVQALNAASAAWLEEAWTSQEAAEEVLYALRMCAERDQTSLSTYMLSLMPQHYLYRGIKPQPPRASDVPIASDASINHITISGFSASEATKLIAEAYTSAQLCGLEDVQAASAALPLQVLPGIQTLLRRPTGIYLVHDATPALMESMRHDAAWTVIPTTSEYETGILFRNAQLQLITSCVHTWEGIAHVQAARLLIRGAQSTWCCCG
eukprot:4461556-Amphidinium_carterae.1